MATFTPNLSLEQQGGGERASLVVLNANLGKIDEFAGKAKGTVITNEYSTVLSAINALRTSKTFPFTIQKAGSSSFSDLPSGVSSTCEWTVVCSGSSERVTAILTIYTGGSSMNGWSWTANIYNGSYILDWTSVNSQINTYSTITPTAYSNRVNIVTSHCYQIGRWVIVYLQLHSNQALSENTLITGLPAPAQRMGLMVNVSGATAIVSTNQADGVFANGVPTNTDFIISGVYNTLQG